MRLFLLLCLTMCAFAGNSVLNRLALLDPDTGPAMFALVRLGAGALVLIVLVRWQGARVPWLATGRIFGVISLSLYIFGFSFAYVNLEAGIGALILFGGVQITMFAVAVWQRETIPPPRWLGSGFALLGLIVLLWPDGTNLVNLFGAGLMIAAALGWGIYSILGRSTKDPLGTTAANFAMSLPIAVLIALVIRDEISLQGVVLGCLSGAITSGLGYALWYAILPKLEVSVAAIAQLSVPVIAAFAGFVLLQEPIGARFVVAAVMVLGGVMIGVRR